MMKRIVLETENELHRAIKLKAFREEKTIKQYLTDLIEEDLQIKKEQTQ